MRNTGFNLTVFGSRGSMAVSRSGHEIFGGATSCYMVRAGDETVFLDAGSGLLEAPTDFPKPPHILLSHLHLDHLLGLGMYPRLSQKRKKTWIYVPTNGQEDPASLLDKLYSPPFWPLSLYNYAGDNRILPLTFPLQIGKLRVEGMPGSHPGGCMLMKLSYRGKSIVYATDYEQDELSFLRLAKFAHGCDLLLYDGQYSEAEYPARRGFGHSTPKKGLELLDRCGVKQMLLIHHDPHSNDDLLLRRESEIGRENVRFAREGECICL